MMKEELPIVCLIQIEQLKLSLSNREFGVRVFIDWYIYLFWLNTFWFLLIHSKKLGIDKNLQDYLAMLGKAYRIYSFYELLFK